VPESTEIWWFHLGADVVVGRMSIARLMAILEALMRRAEHAGPPSGEVRIVGDLTLDADKDDLLVGNRRVHVTPTEFRLLDSLAAGFGRYVPAPRLMHLVWGIENDAVHKSLKVHVSRLRHKLADAGSRCTVAGLRTHGYSLVERADVPGIDSPPPVEDLPSAAP
jgi:two-component system response regulator MprA